VTHATAVTGVERGTFATALAPDHLELSTFSAGPAAIEALFSGHVDAAYVGPSPAINGFVQSRGAALRVVAGATSGGAALVVRRGIDTADDLRGARLASPQLGNTQDIALRYWLSRQGFATTREGGGDVHVIPQENAQTLDTFTRGLIDGAWVPEPWATRLQQEAGGHVLVDERTLWPAGRFATTELVVRTAFLRAHPATVRRLLAAHIAATGFVNNRPEEAQAATIRGIARLTGKRLSPAVVDAAWANLTFSTDPMPDALATAATHAARLGFLTLPRAGIRGIVDRRPLERALADRSREAMTR